jgi:hypothetical protein
VPRIVPSILRLFLFPANEKTAAKTREKKNYAKARQRISQPGHRAIKNRRDRMIGVCRDGGMSPSLGSGIGKFSATYYSAAYKKT